MDSRRGFFVTIAAAIGARSLPATPTSVHIDSLEFHRLYVEPAVKSISAEIDRLSIESLKSSFHAAKYFDSSCYRTTGDIIQVKMPKRFKG